MRILISSFVLACCVLPLSASATGLKPGKWQITATMDMGKDAPAMPALSAEQMEAMKRAGVKMPSMNGPHTMMTCVSPQDAASGKPPMKEDSGCTMKNLKHEGNHSSGEMVCDGQFKGTGTFEMTADGDTGFTSKMHMEGSAHGQPVNMTTTSSGHWLGASCK
ncbi:MAG: DUF3617 domain-containing protein [Stenotrophobium sp.]